MRISRRHRAAIAVVGLAFIAAACGDSSGSSSATTAASSGTTSAAATTASGGAATTAASAGGAATTAASAGGAATTAGTPVAKPTGDPIKLGSIVEVTSAVFSSPEVVKAHDAWVKYMNEEGGGIAGRPVQIVDCDDGSDPAKDAQCAQDLISQGVVAFIDNTALNLAQNGLPLIEKAGIPAIGGTPVSSVEYNSPVNFPTIGGGAGSYPSLMAYFASQGAKTAALVFNGTAAGQGAAQLAAQVFTDHGGTKADIVTYNPADPDYVPALSTAAGLKADVVILATGASTAPRLLQAAAVAGVTSKIGLPGAANTSTVFDAAGSAANGAYFTTGFFPPGAGNAEADNEAAILKKYAPDLVIGEKVQNSVAGLQLLKTMIERTIKDNGSLTSANLLKTLNAVTSETLMAGPKWSPANAPTGLTKVWNSANLIIQFKDGKVTPVSDFISGFSK